MKSLPRLFAVLVLPLLVMGILAGCSGVNSGGGGTKTLTSIAVTPASPAHLKVGATQQFTATGTYSDSSTADITSTVTWNSGTPATATISAAGLATGVAAGTTSITATLGTVTSPGVTLTVISLTSIAVTPNPATVAVASTLQFIAIGTYSDASTADITPSVTWSSLPISSATITSTGGLATGVANGTSQITATLGAVVSPSVTLTVGTGGVPVPVSVKIVQVNPTIAVGGTEDFTAVALLSDGTTAALVTPATWSSGTLATASILSPAGIASGLAVGTSTITASSGALTPGTTLLTVVPAASRFAYVSGQNDVATASYVVNSAGNTLMPFGVLRDTLKPAQVVPEPSGRFAYAISAGATGTIGVYSVDLATGILSNTTGGITAQAAQTGPFQAITDPTGRFLYVANSVTNNVTAVQISSTDGSLSCLGSPAPAPPCTPTPVGNFPVGLVEDRSGKFLYVSNDGDDTISGFSIGADGSLSPLSTPTFATGSAPGLPTIDPSNSFLYVPNSGDNTISVYTIAANGLLAPLGASPFSTGVGSSPTMVVINPANKFLYVTNGGDNTVSAINIVAGGALGTAVGAPTPTGNVPFGIAMDPAGAFVVVANQNDNTVTYYSLNSATGALTPGQTVQTRTTPQLINLYSGIATPVIAPATVEAANSGTSNDLSSYTVNAGTGALTASGTSPTAGLVGNNQAAVGQTGRFFYAATTTAPTKLGAFSVNGSAALTALAGSAQDLSGDTPAGIYAEPSDQFIYVADKTASMILGFTNSSGSISATPSINSPALTSINGVAGDVQGTLMVVLQSAQLQSVPIGSADGSTAAGPVLSLPGTNWTAGAIDATGFFLVAADATGHNLETFQITPVSGLGLPSDGTLTAIGGSTIAAGSNGPYAVTFDPLNRFVFLADLAAGSVKPFTFNSTTGTLTAGTSVPVSVNGVTNVAVDATGKFLYVGIPGTTTSNPSSVAVYSINAGTGALTAVGSPIASGTKTAGVTVTNSIN